jgi:hypothetical protein
VVQVLLHGMPLSTGAAAELCTCRASQLDALQLNVLVTRLGREQQFQLLRAM